MQIGLCRALHTFHHFALWNSFLKELGFEVVLTPGTTFQMVEEGLKVAPSELCLPVKVFLGHITILQQKVDVILIPRLVCRKIGNDFYFGCPKALALPDLTRAIFPNLNEIVELIIDDRIFSETAALVHLARKLKVKKEEALAAYQVAKRTARAADELTRQLATPIHMFNQRSNQPFSRENHLGLKIGLIGHPYLLFDEYLNGGIFKFIKSCGAEPVVLFPEENQIIQNALTKNTPNWYYELELITSARQLVQDKTISGLILFCNFACGTGSVVNELIRREVASGRNIPILTLLIDEHTGETGLKTRLEAFVDLLKVRRQG